MNDSINRLNKKSKFRNKLVVIFGSNQPAEEMLMCLKEKKIDVNALIDNNPKKVGTKVDGINVFAPEELLGNFNNEAIILIASKYYNEMLQQLKAIGYKENKHVFKIVEMGKERKFDLSIITFINQLKRIYRGKKVYKKLRNKYYEPLIFICPFQALGDIYIVGSLWNEYIIQNNINNYVFIVPSHSCSLIAQMFSIHNIEVVKQVEIEVLIQYYLYFGYTSTHIKVLHQRFPYTNKIGNIGNYKKFNFAEHYKYSILGLGDNAIPVSINSYNDQEYIIEIYKKYNLPKGKTVLFAPYANTVSMLTNLFWEKLAVHMKAKGYAVCTNSAGKHEPAINGTIAISFSIEKIYSFIEMAGIFIGLRSGLCDLISGSSCKKIIIYPDRIYQYGEMIDFYSLNNMKLSEDAIEIVCKNEEDCYKKIKDNI